MSSPFMPLALIIFSSLWNAGKGVSVPSELPANHQLLTELIAKGVLVLLGMSLAPFEASGTRPQLLLLQVHDLLTVERTSFGLPWEMSSLSRVVSCWSSIPLH